MIVVLEPDLADAAAVVRRLGEILARYPDVSARLYEFAGDRHRFTELHLIGPTGSIPAEPFEDVPGVLRVVRVAARYRLIGRHDPRTRTFEFTYNGVRFGDRDVHVFAGLCAVDSPEYVDAMMASLATHGITTARMGAYKPRTSPYDFQGLGAGCLPWVFELAGKHGIRVIAMEATNERHIDEIRGALEAAGRPTGVLLQVGTRNSQNFELLKSVGQQREFPVLFKRGMGITLEESLNACEYIAHEGNPNIVFCLRGVKTHLGDPHRNLVDFAHIPVVRRQSRLPICVDPSHSVGRMALGPDGIPDIFHVVGQGIIAGATNVLVDFHPRPEKALCDGGQALRLEDLPKLLRYVERVRAAYIELMDGFATPP
jgi:3-deoxy-7-phosphoheptulonate synthase